MNISVIGLGLIGGSMTTDIKRENLAHVTAYDCDTESLQYALQNDLIDKAEATIPAAIKDADVIVISVPINHFESVLNQIKPHLTENQIVTDVSSVKHPIVTKATDILGAQMCQFVPGHPIAGSEKSGVQFSKANLFERHCTILTPLETTKKEAVEAIADLWKKIGANVRTMTSEEHDKVLAATSHLPHFIAFAYKDIFSGRPEICQFTAGSYKDLTRIANSDRTFWRNIFRANKDELLSEIKRFRTQLDALQEEIFNA